MKGQGVCSLEDGTTIHELEERVEQKVCQERRDSGIHRSICEDKISLTHIRGVQEIGES